jgi:hypothetical protein
VFLILWKPFKLELFLFSCLANDKDLVQTKIFIFYIVTFIEIFLHESSTATFLICTIYNIDIILILN